MILRQQVMFACNRPYRVKPFWQHRIVEQATPVLADGRVMTDRIILFQTGKPAIQHVVVNLIHQLPLAADGVEHLQQGCADQPLGHHRGCTEIGINLVKQAIQRTQRFIDQTAQGSQWMILRDKIRNGVRREHFRRAGIGSAHEFISLQCPVAQGYSQLSPC